MVQRLQATGKKDAGIAILNWQNVPALQIREAGIRAIADHYKIPILFRHEMKVPGQVPDAKQTVTDLLTRYPAGGPLACVWCGWDEVAGGASQAIKQAGRQDVFAVGIDGNLSTYDAIRAGDPQAATCANDMESITRACLQQLSAILGGGKPSATTMYVDAPFIAKQNVPPPNEYPHGQGLTTYFQA